MKRRIKRLISGVSVFIVLLGALGSASASSAIVGDSTVEPYAITARSRNIAFYYTGAPTGSNEYCSFYLAKSSGYYFKETSHHGPCQGINIWINSVYIGNPSCSALCNNGYPVGYSISSGDPHIEVSFRHGNGVASSNITVTAN